MRRVVHPDVVVLLVALMGTASLGALSALLEPPSIAVGDAPLHESARVAVVGRVLDVHEGARGRFLVVADASHRIAALASHGEPLSPGDVVRLVGVVARLDGAWGVHAERVEVVERAASRVLSPADLAREPSAYVGARVLVRGEARGDALAGDGARVRVVGEPAPERGGWWLAAGTFEYREREAAFVLRVDAWTPRS